MSQSLRRQSRFGSGRRWLASGLLLAGLRLLAMVGWTPGVVEANVTTAHAAAPKLSDPDARCAGCHQAIYAAYRKTPMARGSGLAVDGLIPGGVSA